MSRKSKYIVNCYKCGKPVRILSSQGKYITCEPKPLLIYPSERGQTYYKGTGIEVKGSPHHRDGFECYELHKCPAINKML